MFDLPFEPMPLDSKRGGLLEMHRNPVWISAIYFDATTAALQQV